MLVLPTPPDKKNPPKETCYYLNRTAAYRSRKARSQPFTTGHFKSSMCFESWAVSDTDSKQRVKSHGKLFKVSLTSVSPKPPMHAPCPTIGQRRNAVQRFCRMSHKQVHKQTDGGKNALAGTDLWWSLAGNKTSNDCGEVNQSHCFFGVH